MPVKRRKAKIRKTDFEDWQIIFLERGIVPPDGADPDINIFETSKWKFHMCRRGDEVRAAWKQSGEVILADWIKQYPGTRPYAWWEFDAPRCPDGTWPGCYWDGKLPEPRKRLGGTGTPAHDVLNYVPYFRFGLPTQWVNQRETDYYNGRSRDVHGNRIEKWGGGYYEEGNFKGVPIDPADPPLFESEAAYLDRHGLLSAAERKALPAGALEPVRVCG